MADREGDSLDDHGRSRADRRSQGIEQDSPKYGLFQKSIDHGKESASHELKHGRTERQLLSEGAHSRVNDHIVDDQG
jgi:hypothetical protein